MKHRAFDLETVRESFVYLYRCWLQKYWDVVPQLLSLTDTDGVLVAPSIQLYYSTCAVSPATVSELQKKFGPVCLLAPSLPTGAIGVTEWCSEGLPKIYADVLEFVLSKLDWLDHHSERGILRAEAYETCEIGRFEIWKAKRATRVLLQPQQSDLYGYAVITNKPSDYFFTRSRSCSKEGTIVGAGRYKRSEHRFETSKRTNLDPIYQSGDVFMLSMRTVGAGYKVFPRLSPEPSPEGF